MSSVLHVLDSSVSEVELQVLQLLRSRATGHRHAIAAIDGATKARAAEFLGVEIELVPQRLPAALHWAPQLSQWARRMDGAVYHAWGLEAAQACKARGETTTIVLTVLRPERTDDVARWLRGRPAHVAVIVGSQVVRSRLVGRGVPPDRVVVVRGGVDFAAINSAREARQWKTDGPVILMDGPPSRSGGQFYGLWAVAIVAQIHRGLRVIMPYEGQEAERLARFFGEIRMQGVVIRPPARSTWADLLAGASLFLAPAIEDSCVESIGWAMAAGVPVVGTATRAITELIADKHNGLLAKPKEPRALASRLLTAIEDQELRRRVIETARGQAYEVFSVRSFVENCERVYANTLSGQPAGEGVRDHAFVA